MCIKGTGVDIIEIERIKKVVSSSNKFVSRVYTNSEIEYFNSRNSNPCHLAGTFAAKEAVLKALGTGLRDMDWKDIEIKRNSLGKPIVVLHGNAVVLANSLGIKKMHISISHSRDYAIAQATAEGGDEDEECINF